ncbi:MAG: FHA domain-containing protein [Bacteroidaceae bacterium]|nr:FHA domain-containing protein [Bacteroidaceae bacterium]
MICPKCKSEIDADSFYCDQCGQEIRYCSSCRTLGKGNRCTRCGQIMIPASVCQKEPVHDYVYPDTTSVQLAGIAPLDKTLSITSSKMPTLILSNGSLGIRIEGIDGAIIGRRNGAYQQFFAQCPYVSGTHARIAFDVTLGEWTYTDLNSSNGSKYNGLQLIPDKPCSLSDGGMLQLADVQLIVNVK